VGVRGGGDIPYYLEMRKRVSGRHDHTEFDRVLEGGYRWRVECRVRELAMKRNGIGKEADRGGLPCVGRVL
jgi:hypothetical protein